MLLSAISVNRNEPSTAMSAVTALCICLTGHIAAPGLPGDIPAKNGLVRGMIEASFCARQPMSLRPKSGTAGQPQIMTR